MTLVVTHTKVSGAPAGSDPNRIYGTHWDAEHTLSGLGEFDDTVTIATPAGATNKALNITQTGPSSGSTVGEITNFTLGNPHLVYNSINVTDESNVGGGGQSYADALLVGILTGGTNSEASKSAATFNLYKASASAPAVARDHVSVVSNALADGGDGGTAPDLVSSAGTLFAYSGNATIRSGCTNYFEVCAGEIQTAINTGASAAYRFGWNIVSGGNERGSVLDAAMVLSGSSGPGWQYGIIFGGVNGGGSFDTDSTLLWGNSQDPKTVATCLDFSSYTFSAYMFNFGSSYTLSGSGVATHGISSAANTSGDGIILNNPAAAAAGDQRYSPRLRLTGQGWKTDATAASQTVDWIIENRPVQDAANPSTKLAFSSQINAAGYNERFSILDNASFASSDYTFTTPGGAAKMYFSIGASNNVATAVVSASLMQIGTITDIPLNFQQNNVVKITLDTDGQIIMLPDSTTPATLGTNGQYTLTPTSNTNFRISYRGSDGVTRVGNITLA